VVDAAATVVVVVADATAISAAATGHRAGKLQANPTGSPFNQNAPPAKQTLRAGGVLI
jgi:hypothetical protein